MEPPLQEFWPPPPPTHVYFLPHFRIDFCPVVDDSLLQPVRVDKGVRGCDDQDGVEGQAGLKAPDQRPRKVDRNCCQLERKLILQV